MRKSNPAYVTKVTEPLHNVITKLVLFLEVPKDYFCYLPDYSKTHKKC